MRQKLTHKQMRELFAQFVHDVWKQLINPPELNLRIELPGWLAGFSHIPLVPKVEKKPYSGRIMVPIGIDTKPRIRFVRRVQICVQQSGKPFDGRRPDLIKWMKNNGISSDIFSKEAEGDREAMGVAT